MSRSNRYNLRSDADDYRKGYADGMKAAFEETELDAYYAGVGYGKKVAKTKHIGFSNPEERENFEKGIRNHNKHFHSYKAEKSFFEKLFGRREESTKAISYPSRRKLKAKDKGKKKGSK